MFKTLFLALIFCATLSAIRAHPLTICPSNMEGDCSDGICKLCFNGENPVSKHGACRCGDSLPCKECIQPSQKALSALERFNCTWTPYEWFLGHSLCCFFHEPTEPFAVNATFMSRQDDRYHVTVGSFSQDIKSNACPPPTSYPMETHWDRNYLGPAPHTVAFTDSSASGGVIISFKCINLLQTCDWVIGPITITGA